MTSKTESIGVKSKSGMKTDYNVEQISNGWILTENTYGTNDKGEYISKNVKTFSKEDPLKEKVDKIQTFKKALGKDTDNDGE